MLTSEWILRMLVTSTCDCPLNDPPCTVAEAPLAAPLAGLVLTPGAFGATVVPAYSQCLKGRTTKKKLTKKKQKKQNNKPNP